MYYKSPKNNFRPFVIFFGFVYLLAFLLRPADIHPRPNLLENAAPRTSLTSTLLFSVFKNK